MEVHLEENQDNLFNVINSEIPKWCSELKESSVKLSNLAEYCEANYGQANTPKAKQQALDSTKALTDQSLASVAYQIHVLANNFLKLLDLQSAQLESMDLSVNLLAETISCHKEKVSRREIGTLTSNKPPGKQTVTGVVYPSSGPEKPQAYNRMKIDYSLLDDIGHGVRIPSDTRNTLSLNSNMQNKQMYSDTAPSVRPPSPPRGSTASTLLPSGTLRGRGMLRGSALPHKEIATPTPPSDYQTRDYLNRQTPQISSSSIPSQHISSGPISNQQQQQLLIMGGSGNYGVPVIAPNPAAYGMLNAPAPGTQTNIREQQRLSNLGMQQPHGGGMMMTNQQQPSNLSYYQQQTSMASADYHQQPITRQQQPPSSINYHQLSGDQQVGSTSDQTSPPLPSPPPPPMPASMMNQQQGGGGTNIMYNTGIAGGGEVPGMIPISSSGGEGGDIGSRESTDSMPLPPPPPPAMMGGPTSGQQQSQLPATAPHAFQQQQQQQMMMGGSMGDANRMSTQHQQQMQHMGSGVGTTGMPANYNNTSQQIGGKAASTQQQMGQQIGGGIVVDENNAEEWVPPGNYMEKVIAIYDYNREKDDELDLHEDQVVYVIRKNDDGWWEGIVEPGIRGLFPGNYVEPVL